MNVPERDAADPWGAVTLDWDDELDWPPLLEELHPLNSRATDNSAAEMSAVNRIVKSFR
ncbi:hypothetical protein [Mycobacterium sp. TY815]|uniref:hypothetical protein n=1 Tax=Mycobacterium sp. TY815 TaxID=3050581 RepID=UPI0027422A5F|nr:hypothetical protein [Mycobacterium sp. TY815]MDP7706990.1 hypothetical protein [Mycobacterium sp. TY815]